MARAAAGHDADVSVDRRVGAHDGSAVRAAAALSWSGCAVRMPSSISSTNADGSLMSFFN